MKKMTEVQKTKNALTFARNKADKESALEYRAKIVSEVMEGREWKGYKKITINERGVLGDTIKNALIDYAMTQGRKPGKDASKIHLLYANMMNDALVIIDPALKDVIKKITNHGIPDWMTNMQLLHLAAVMKITSKGIRERVNTGIKYNAIRLDIGRNELDAYVSRVGGRTRLMEAYVDEYLLPALAQREIDDRRLDS